MSPRDSEEAMSSASPITSVDRQQTAGPSSVVGENIACASPTTFVDQQQSAESPSVVESSASPAALNDQQQSAESPNVVESSASSAALNNQQQSAESPSVVESSACPAALKDRDGTVGSSSAVEDELREQIAGLKDDIRELKLKQDLKPEAVKHKLLQEEVAQLREKNPDLRVELQVAQEKHH